MGFQDMANNGNGCIFGGQFVNKNMAIPVFPPAKRRKKARAGCIPFGLQLFGAIGTCWVVGRKRYGGYVMK